MKEWDTLIFLQTLIPLCEDDNQTNEIVKKLEKSLQFLNQHTARVASRAEMLGAIHQVKDWTQYRVYYFKQI